MIKYKKQAGVTNETAERVAIAGAVCAAIGSFGGALKDLDAPHLGSIVIKEALHRCGIEGE